MPPARCRSVATNRPPGLRSASSGTRALTLSKSSMVSGTPASRAIASRCSTALVEPPVAATAAIAFSSAGLRDDLARTKSAPQHVHHQRAGGARDRRPCPGRRAGTLALPNGEMPRNSHTVAIVLAVNWPPHAPAPGTGLALERVEVLRSSACPAACAPTASKTSWMVTSRSCQWPGRDRPAVEHQAGHVEPRQRHHRGGNRLVAADQHDQRRRTGCRAPTSSIESAMTSRLTSEVAHALGAHGDAVGDRDGVELERRAAGLANAVLHVRPRARAGGSCTGRSRSRCWRRRPAAAEILVGQAGGAEHGARRGAARPVGQRGAAPLERMGGHVIGVSCDQSVPVAVPARGRRVNRPDENKNGRPRFRVTAARSSVSGSVRHPHVARRTTPSGTRMMTTR